MSDKQMTSPVVLWDFDGTLAACEGMWRGALLAAVRTPDSTGHAIGLDQAVDLVITSDQTPH